MGHPAVLKIDICQYNGGATGGLEPPVWRLRGGVEDFEDAVEVFEGFVFEDDLALAVFVLDLDAEAQGALELLLGFADVGIEDALGLGERRARGA